MLGPATQPQSTTIHVNYERAVKALVRKGRNKAFNVYCPECPPGDTIVYPGGQLKKVFAFRSQKGPSGI